MKNIKKSLKKGGIADIVTLVLIIGLAVVLVITVVLPMVKKADAEAAKNETRMDSTTGFIDSFYDKNSSNVTWP